jgi:lipid II:glycine glycyltransferase (peptidoglycan interpeptide bridge formation enzyme)
LVLRLFPILFDFAPESFSTLLAEEGFSSVAEQRRGRTILMDLRPSLEHLRGAMLPHWQRELKAAERNRLELVEGTGQELFDSFIDIYKEMVARKRFIEPNDIHQFHRIQLRLPDQLKMKIMLCRSGTDFCSGVICSAIGDTAVYLFGATSNVGMKSKGSYLLQLELLKRLKANGILEYNLNGINPTKNPGTYKFKNELAGTNGRDVHFLGRFDSRAGALSTACVEFGEKARTVYRTLKEEGRTGRGLKLWLKRVS